MQFLMRLLGALPRTATVPVIVLLAGWYGGAKYGAPDYVMSSIDGMINQGTTMVGGLLNQDKDDSTEDTDNSNDG